MAKRSSRPKTILSYPLSYIIIRQADLNNPGRSFDLPFIQDLDVGYVSVGVIHICHLIQDLL